MTSSVRIELMKICSCPSANTGTSISKDRKKKAIKSSSCLPQTVFYMSYSSNVYNIWGWCWYQLQLVSALPSFSIAYLDLCQSPSTCLMLLLLFHVRCTNSCFSHFREVFDYSYWRIDVNFNAVQTSSAIFLDTYNLLDLLGVNPCALPAIFLSSGSFVWILCWSISLWFEAISWSLSILVDLNNFRIF